MKRLNLCFIKGCEKKCIKKNHLSAYIILTLLFGPIGFLGLGITRLLKVDENIISDD